MLTKGAIGNLINRYKAVLKKCNLINTFGSLAVASMLVLGATGVAEATIHEASGEAGKTVADIINTEGANTVQDGDTIKITANHEGDGFRTRDGGYRDWSDKGITFDFNKYTYNVSGKAEGSQGTKSQGAQLLYDQVSGEYAKNKITFKNGTFTATSKDVLMMVNNYINLTIDNMVIDGSKLTNAGTGARTGVTTSCLDSYINKSQIITTDKDIAVAVIYDNSERYGEGVSMSISDSKIVGKIKMYGDELATGAYHNLDLNNLTISNNDFNGNGGALSVETLTANATITDCNFENNKANGLGGAIYNIGTVNFSGTNTFGDAKDASKNNTANGTPNDIYNAGTINIVDGKTTMQALENNGGLVNVTGGKLVVSDSFTSTGGVSGLKTSNGTDRSGVHALVVENGEASLSGTTNINVESADRVRAVRNEGGTLTLDGDVTITAKSTAPSVFTLGFDNRGKTTFTGTKTSISAIGLGDNTGNFGQGYAVQSVGGELNFNADTTSLAGYASKVFTDSGRITNAILLTSGTKVAFNGNEATLTAENDGSNTAQAVCFLQGTSNSLTFNADKTDIISKSAYGVSGINGDGSHRIEFKKGVTTITSAVTGNGVADVNSNAIGIRQTNGASLEVAEDATLNINVYGASYERYGTAGVESGAQNTINGNLNIVVKSGQTVEGYNEFNASTPAKSETYAYSNAYGIRLGSGGTLTAGENSKLTIDVSEGHLGKAYAMHVADGANVTLGETETTAKAQSDNAFGFYIKGNSTGIFNGPVSLTAESEKKNGYGLYLAGSADKNLENDPKLTFNGKTTITVGSETNAANTGWQQGVRLEYSSAEFNDGLDIKVTDKGTSAKAYVAAISALGDKIDETDAFSSITIKGDSDIDVNAAGKEALGINASGGFATAIESGTVDINVASSTVAYGANVQYGGKITSATGTTLNFTVDAPTAYALNLDYYAGDVGSVDIDGALNLTAQGKESGVALSLVKDATADFGGTTTINATATDAANAHAIYGAGSVTNSGDLTVESGKLAGFTGTYTQTAGSTDLKGASDFFGGTVAINGGSLIVDATNLDAAYAAEVKGANIASGSNLIVDFANLEKDTYSLEEYNKAQSALLGEGEGLLTFLNASLEELKDEGTQLVVGGTQGTDGTVTLAGNPTIVEDGEAPKDSSTSIPSVPSETVQLVDNTTGELLSPEAINVNGQTLAMQSIGVGDDTEDGAALNVLGGSDITFTGDPVVDQKGDAIVVDVNVEGSTLNLGMDGVESDQPADVVLGDVTLGAGAQMNVINSSVQSGELNLGAGASLFLDPSYKSFTSLGAPLAGKAVVGDGSVLVIGEVDNLEENVNKAGFKTSALGSGFVVDSDSAVLALGETIELAPTGSILVDATATSATPVDANSVTFAGKSLLVVNSDVVASANGAIKADGNATLTVKDGAALYIVDAKSGQKYTLVSGFDTAASSVEGWDNVIVNSLSSAQIKVDGDDIVLETVSKDAADVFPGIIPTAGMNEMIATGANAVEAADAGIKFLSRAIEPQYLASTDTVDLVNEVSRAAVTAGVQNTSLRIADAASNTVLDHMSLASNTASVHSDGADFWAAPMYGNLYTSGMATAGSSVRGQFGGLALGADLEAGQFLGGKFRLGAAINGGGGQSETKGNVTSTQNDYDFGGLNFYAAWNKGALNIIGSLGYGFGNNDVEMGLPSSMGMGTAKADIDTSMFTADLRAEYQLKTDWVDVLPHAGIRYTALKTDAHDLKVGGAVLNSVQSDTQNIVQFPIGVTLSKDFDLAGWTVKPSADVSVIPAAGDKKATTKVNFSGLDAWDSVNTRVMDSTSWAGTIGIQAEKGNMTFGLNYGVQASSHETDQNIQVKFGWKF